VEHNAQTEGVEPAVVRLTIENLWRNLVRGSSESFGKTFSQFDAQTQVHNFDLFDFVKIFPVFFEFHENIFKFQIAVYDIGVVEMGCSQKYLEKQF